MARAAYFAPGVYVEEVPSAQQPIAGVGTSTAGFIGIVGKELYLPVANADYDPVAARVAMDLAELRQEQKDLKTSGSPDPARSAEIDIEIQTDIAKLQARANDIGKDIAKLDKKRIAADKEATEAEQASSDAAPKLKAAKEAFDSASEQDKESKRRELESAESDASAKEAAHREALLKKNEIAEKITGLNSEKKQLESEITGAQSATTQQSASAGSPSGESKESKAEKDDLKFENKPDDTLLTKSILRPYVLEKFKVHVDVCDTKLCTNFSEYTKRFGTFSAYKADPENPTDNPDRWRFRPMYPGHHALTHAVNGFFQNGGTKCYVARIEGIEQLKDALKAFESIDEVALIAAPGLPKTPDNWEALMTYCEDINRENVFAILDSPEVVNDGETDDFEIKELDVPRPSKNAAYYFPHIEVVDPAKQLQDADPTRQVGAKYRGRTYVPTSGHVAGIYARTDVERGVHKAPANCVVRGALEVKYYVSKPIQETLNPVGVNAIRIMNDAVTVWGARTCGGDRNGEWKYINVRRLFLFLQESIDEGTQWIVFEPNDPGLWSKIRLNISAFLTNVWRNGALFGLTPEEAFYVKCDAETNPPEVRDLGMVVTEIGVAIVRPAEFVIFRITQTTGQHRA